VTGNPVRPDIAALDTPAVRYAGRSGPLDVLVVGGSLGARVLNDTLPAALALIEPTQRPRVVHQCGVANVDGTRAAYAAAGVTAEVLPFIDDIATRYAAADVVICRAGAITVSELCVAGVPAVLVPFVVRTTQHQRSNAQWLADQGAAVHLPQEDLNAARLAQELRRLTRARLVEIAGNARALGRPSATARVADAIEHLAGGGAQRARALDGP
jgi:UDP-N-acetylglucosamine--N-acetylmuramyl-(pentapeptide) pyrophosphoryl-undecaprenol N-acetylglucosamine transferase